MTESGAGGAPVAPEADQPEHHRADDRADQELAPVERGPHRIVEGEGGEQPETGEPDHGQREPGELLARGAEQEHHQPEARRRRSAPRAAS